MRGVLNLLTVRPRFWWTFRALEVCYVYLRQPRIWPLTLECHAVLFKYCLFCMNTDNIYMSGYWRVYIMYECVIFIIDFWYSNPPTHNSQKYGKSIDRHTWTQYFLKLYSSRYMLDKLPLLWLAFWWEPSYQEMLRMNRHHHDVWAPQSGKGWDVVYLYLMSCMIKHWL